MYSCTEFGQLMKGLSRPALASSVRQFSGDKYNKGFDSYDHLLAMVFAHVSGCSSLREIEAGFNSAKAHHHHLGVGEIKRSTLSDANSKRDSRIFQHACHTLMSGVSRGYRKRLQERLLIIDSTPIRLAGRGYDQWTDSSQNGRIQGLKTHVVMCSESGMPEAVEVTAANVNDLDVGKTLKIEAGALYAMDKAYCDYNWWNSIDEAGAYFVTRLKVNASVVDVEQKDCQAHEGIVSDTVIKFKTKSLGARRKNAYFGKPLRRIVVDRSDKSTLLTLVTNDLERSAAEIAQIYKRRWEIENFFKWLKQNLKLKRFLGRSENAVRIQIYTAIITQLLVELYRQRQGLSGTAKMILITLRTRLFQPVETAHQRQKKREQAWYRFNLQQKDLVF